MILKKIFARLYKNLNLILLLVLISVILYIIYNKNAIIIEGNKGGKLKKEFPKKAGKKKAVKMFTTLDNELPQEDDLS